MIIALVLIAGAIINVAVAWGCSFWNSEMYPMIGHTGWHLNQQVFDAHLYKNRSSCRVVTREDREMNGEHRAVTPQGLQAIRHILTSEGFPRWSYPWQTLNHSESADRAEQQTVSDRASGWPLLTMRCRFLGQSQLGPIPPLECGIRLEPRFAHTFPTKIYIHRALPLRPIWPGFAINTIFYAAVLWVLFAVPVKVRRWRRIKRGLCAACGYSLHQSLSDKCPECGAAIILRISQ
jgi:hypothetical protein